MPKDKYSYLATNVTHYLPPPSKHISIIKFSVSPSTGYFYCLLSSFALPLFLSFPVTSKPMLAAQPLIHAAVTLIYNKYYYYYYFYYIMLCCWDPGRLAALVRWLSYYSDQTGFILPRMLMLCMPRYVTLYIRM